MAPNTNSVDTMNTAPNCMTCKPTGPSAGVVNCGRKAKKNRSTLGLVRFMTMPRRYSAPGFKGSGALPVSDSTGARRICQAR
ncbi:hypothetical protein D3C73_1449120 [compost metagenome]